MSEQASLLLILVVFASYIFSMVETLKVQHKFLRLYKQINQPEFPINIKELYESGSPVSPFLPIQAGINTLKIIWQRHEDNKLDQLAKSIRLKLYRSVAILFIGIGFIIALALVLKP